MIAVAVTALGASDSGVLATARSQGRVLITEDRDFGEFVVRQRLEVHGVVLLEPDRLSTEAAANHVATFLSANADKLAGNLHVIEPGRVRLRPLRQ